MSCKADSFKQIFKGNSSYWADSYGKTKALSRSFFSRGVISTPGWYQGNAVLGVEDKKQTQNSTTSVQYLSAVGLEHMIPKSSFTVWPLT